MSLSIANATKAQASPDGTNRCSAQPRDLVTARALFEQAATLQGEAAVILGQAMTFEKQKNQQAASEKYEAASKKYEAATLKYAESLRLDRSIDTLLNLGECFEQQNRPASAYSYFMQAASLAHDQGNVKFERLAKKYAGAIATERSFVTIHVEAPTPGLRILRDNEIVGAAQLDVSLPIDPGDHVVAASADGYASFEQRVSIGGQSEQKTVTLPALTPIASSPLEAPLPSALPLPTAKPPATPKSQVAPPLAMQSQAAPPPPSNPWPWVLGGVGASALLVGGVAGALALHDKSALASACPDSQHCSDPSALAIQPRRDFEWTLARVTFPIGIVALGAATTLWALDSGKQEQPKAESAVKGLGASVGHRSGQVWLTGRF